MSLIIRGGSILIADQSLITDFSFEDEIIHTDSPFCALYYGVIEKRSAYTAPFAVER